MARRSFYVIDIVEILVHWYAGRSQHELAASLGVDRKTIRRYVAPAVAAGMVPGGPGRSQAQWAELVRSWFPELVDTRLRQVTWPGIEVHRDYIAAQLRENVTAATIHQRLRDEQGLDASVASFRRWVRANLPEELRRQDVRVLGQTPPPGQEAQVDYGRLGMWMDPSTGRRVTVWAFVMVLSCSRHVFVRPVLRMDQRAWTEAHVEAFGFFGGVPSRIVPENVPRNIFGLLFPIALCGRRRRAPEERWFIGLSRPHNDQSDDSQSSSAWSDLQIGRARDPSEMPAGSVFRSASIFAFVVISA
jgi:transposase